MDMTRPEASDTTGTLRPTSAVTAPVTINSDVAGWLTAAANGNCSGWSTLNRVISTAEVTRAGGGAVSGSLAFAPWHAAVTTPKNSVAIRQAQYKESLFI